MEGARTPPSQSVIAVVIPSYRASKTILQVISGIGPEVDQIFVVDDKCPEETGRVAQEKCDDSRVTVVFLPQNQGVGGAVIAGIKAAIGQGADIIVKVDADGQMNPKLIRSLIRPILRGDADYVKGNRFFFLADSIQMPRVRRVGNVGLSFLTKLSTGYWNIMDPTNGFFGIEARVARALPLDAIAKRFFFESDLLYHLGLVRAKVVDFPMKAHYGDEVSNLNSARETVPFFMRNMRNLARRIVYKYFFRDFSLASLELIVGTVLLVAGLLFGGWNWYHASIDGTSTPTGTIMITALLLIFSFQLLLSVLNYDVSTVPRDALHPLLSLDDDDMPQPVQRDGPATVSARRETPVAP